MLLVGMLYFPTHVLALEVAPSWDFDEGGLMNIPVTWIDTGMFRYPLLFRTPDERPHRPTIYGPGHFLPLGVWMRCFGVSPGVARAFSVFVTFLVIWVSVETAYAIAGIPAAVVTAFLLCGSVHFQALARVVRPEPSQVLWQCVALWAAIRGWRSPHAGWWAVAGAAAAASILSHYVGLWIAAVITVYLLCAHWGRWHRAPGVYVGLATLLVPLGVYWWWLGAEDRAFLGWVMGWYSDVALDTRPDSIFHWLQTTLAHDWAKRIPWVERGGMGFWGLSLPKPVIWWHRGWLLVGAVGPLVMWPLIWLRPGRSHGAPGLALLALATWGGLTFHLLVYPNKELVYVPGMGALLYTGAGVVAGVAWYAAKRRRAAWVWRWRPVFRLLWPSRAVGCGISWTRLDR